MILLTALSVLTFAEETPVNKVYFPAGTPYLIKISGILEEHNYMLANDSKSAAFKGELYYFKDSGDSIRCEIHLTNDDGAAFILDSFMTEPVDQKNVRTSVTKFSIWMLLLNALTAILFFVR